MSMLIGLPKYEMHEIFHPLMIRAVTMITVADPGFIQQMEEPGPTIHFAHKCTA